MEEEEDPMKIGGGTQQTCDACRTVMEELLDEWHKIDNDSFLEAINEAANKKEYVPVVPKDEAGIKEYEAMVKRKLMQRCQNIDIWIKYKPSIRKACETIVKSSGTDIAHILTEKNAEVDTDIMNYLTRVVCMGFNRLCTIKYLNLDARSVNTKCENCVNIARLLEYQTRRASKKYIERGYFFDNVLESICEKIPFFYSRPNRIGTLCEEMVGDHDEEIVKVLQGFLSGKYEHVEEALCVSMTKICSVKEYTRIQHYDYRNALRDFQGQQDIRSVPMEDMDLFHIC